MKLVPRKDTATVEAIRAMLNRAIEGRLTGLVWVELMPGKNYHAEMVGTAYADPTWTRGCVCALDDELRELIHHYAEVAPDFTP